MIKPLIEEIDDFRPSVQIFNALKDRPYTFFLDSNCDHGKLGRFSFLGCDPFLVFRSKGDSATLEWQDGRTENIRSNPFHALKSIFKKYDLESCGHLPLTSGAVGYFGYDLKDFIEKLPDKSCDDLNLADCILGFYDVIMIYDHLELRAYMASSGLPYGDGPENCSRQKERLKDFKDKVAKGLAAQEENSRRINQIYLRSNFSKEGYAAAVEKAKLYIRKGDIYQVNLSQRFEAKVDMCPAELYSKLRDANPAPFSAYLGFGDVFILSSSPERFLLKKGRYIETRPIKGTRPRGFDEFEDCLLEKELLESAKDRAEHIMIVDLERNDLGRVCEYGSVRPAESFILERYATVFHLVSTVTGTLREDIDPIDCLVAAFPGGSITGAPKIRSMEIIEELEPVKRSVYTGAIGYISFGGNMDTSIVIRTFIMKGDEVYFHAGGGIVADSVPEQEYEETIDKARGLLKALGAEK